LLYSIEGNGWIKGVWNQRKRVCALTEEGERHVEVIEESAEETRDFLRGISLLNAPSGPPN